MLAKIGGAVLGGAGLLVLYCVAVVADIYLAGLMALEHGAEPGRALPAGTPGARSDLPARSYPSGWREGRPAA